MIYLDSSAVLKLVLLEAETAPLDAWLRTNLGTALVSSELGKIEVLRAARRASKAALYEARAVVDDLDLIALDAAVQDLASDIGDPLLRTLDALHLASALLVADVLTAFVSYDQRLLAAARSAGLTAVAPGAP